MSVAAILILSDDVTGAADCLSYTAPLGIASSIVCVDRLPAAPSGIFAISSDSRHLHADQAAEVVARTVRSLPSGPDVLWFKKIDSHLRGHAGAEIDAVLNQLPPETVAVVSPALPSYRRGMKDGMLLSPQLLGQRVHVPTLLASETTRHVGALGLEIVERGERDLAQAMAAEQRAGSRILVADALNEEHLNRIARAARSLSPVLFAGSAGLLGETAKEAFLNEPNTPPIRPVGLPTRRVLGVIGSGTRMSHRQLDALRVARPVSVVEFPAFGEEKVFIPKRGPALEDVLFVHLPAPPPDVRLDGKDARSLAAKMIPFIMDLIPCFEPDVLLFSGGDTAELFLRALGVTSLELERGILPGMPLLRGKDSFGKERGVILKSGSHGEEGALSEILKRLESTGE